MPSADAAHRWKRATGLANPGLGRGRFGGVFDAPAAAASAAATGARVAVDDATPAEYVAAVDRPRG